MRTNTVFKLILLVFLLIVGWDIYLYSDDVVGNSISQVIIAYSEKSMMLPWFIGLLMGGLAVHWFDNHSEGK